MIQDEKELLLKDLSGRLPYGVKIKFNHVITSPAILKGINNEFIECDIAVCELEDIKPYLFPMSSMTEEQKEEYFNLQQKVIYNSKGLVNSDVMEYVNWCYKNHIDINNLIPMGLANDATNLNIY